MIRARTLVLCSLVALSCGGKGASKFRGHWQGVEARGVIKGGDPKSATEFATTMDLVVRSRDLTLSFRGSKGQPEKLSSGYRIVRDDGHRLVIETELDKGEQAIFEFPTDNTLIWEAVEGSRVVFERVLE